jgi:hypothetical protein
MKAWSVIGLLFAAAIFATIPISAQVTPRGLELSVDGAKAITYGHARRVNRRVERREYRHERRAHRRGYYSCSNANAATAIRRALARGPAIGRARPIRRPVRSGRMADGC